MDRSLCSGISVRNASIVLLCSSQPLLSLVLLEAFSLGALDIWEALLVSAVGGMLDQPSTS